MCACMCHQNGLPCTCTCPGWESRRSAELAQRTNLINPWPIWGLEDENEFGEVAPGKLWIELVEVNHPDDGSLWVTCMFRRRVMLRKDVLDLTAVDANHWGFPHKPAAWNSLSGQPCARPTRARFRPEDTAPLLQLGVRVLPLSSSDEQVRPMAHAIMRGEDFIGYIMSSDRKGAEPLPEALQVRVPPGMPSGGDPT